MVSTAFDPSLIEPERLRPLSRREYDRLVDLGWFEDEPIELLRGMLVTMSPQKWPHAAAVAFLNEQLVLQLAGRYAVRPQLPFARGDAAGPGPRSERTLAGRVDSGVVCGATAPLYAPFVRLGR